MYCLIGTFGGIEQYAGAEHSYATPRRAPQMRFVSSPDRLAEFQAVRDILGVDGWDVMYGNEFHIALDTVPQRDLIARIERSSSVSIDTLAPTMLLMPAATFNQDHDALFRACLAASRPTGGCRRSRALSRAPPETLSIATLVCVAVAAGAIGESVNSRQGGHADPSV